MATQTTSSIKIPRFGTAQVKLLERLSNACSVSGDEGEVRKIIQQELRPIVDEMRIDHLGNLLAIKRGEGENQLRVMLAAHMDEVGFMLVHQEDREEGIFRFDMVGGVSSSHLAGQPVWIGSEHTPGVIGAKPIHLTNGEETRNNLSVESLRIDIGPGNGGKVKVGDRAAFATKFTRIGPSLRGKALDDRLGVATLIELIKHAPPNIDILAAFTVQEEVGLRGAKVAAYALDPDLAIVLESTIANDLPTWDGSENIRYNSRLDAGPAIYLADSGTLSDPRLVRHLIETAETLGIPYQFRQPGGGRTDASEIHKQRTGIPSVSISTPGRYMHTPVMIARFSDWKNTFSLVYAALLRLTPHILKPES